MSDLHPQILPLMSSQSDYCLHQIKVSDAEGMYFQFQQSIRDFVQEQVKKVSPMKQLFQRMLSTQLMTRMV
jgi:hypothetical protein